METSFVLTPQIVLGLFFIQRYRFLTITQFAKASGLSHHRSEDLLRSLEARGITSHFGNALIPGHGRTPKAYYLKRKGWELLRRESDIPDELLGSFVETHQEASWSPQMYHRLRLLDLMIALEVEVRTRPRFNLVRTLIEYRRTRKNGRLMRETTDFVAKDEIPENRIIPDGAFILENVATKQRALFFVEMDMATERIVTQITSDHRVTLRFKIEQYDRYLTGGRYATTYKQYGAFDHFTLLFVTYGEERIQNILHALADLPAHLGEFYRFSTFEQATDDFLGQVWKSRLPQDSKLYPLVN